MPKRIPNVAGATELAETLGSWPDFHDAEIHELALVRDSESHVVVDRCPGSSEPAPVARWIKIELFEIEALELHDFSNQNVVSAVVFEEGIDGTTVRIGPCFGVHGFIRARRVRIEVLVGDPAGSR